VALHLLELFVERAVGDVDVILKLCRQRARRVARAD
jgi:hypothetical protein